MFRGRTPRGLTRIFNYIHHFFRLVRGLLSFSRFGTILLFFGGPNSRGFVGVVYPIFCIVRLITVYTRLVQALTRYLRFVRNLTSRNHFLLGRVSRLFPLIQGEVQVVSDSALNATICSVGRVVRTQDRIVSVLPIGEDGRDDTRFVRGRVNRLVTLTLRVFSSFVVFHPLLEQIVTRCFCRRDQQKRWGLERLLRREGRFQFFQYRPTGGEVLRGKWVCWMCWFVFIFIISILRTTLLPQPTM